MIESYQLKRNRRKSLTAQIAVVEKQVSSHQQAVSVRTSVLARKIRQQLTAPGSLLLAGGIGFIFGELTKSCGPGDKSKASEASPVTTALNLVISLRTLYMALPVAWIMRTFKQRKPLLEGRYRRATTTSGTTDSRLSGFDSR